MSLKKWEKILVKNLTGISKRERQTVLEYYREIYGDKLEAGYTEEEILKEFGEPETCARKILSEENGVAFDEPKMKTVQTGYSVGAIVGLACMTVLLVIPLYAVIVAVAATFASCVAAGVAFVIGGGAYTLVAPFFYGINGAPVGGVIANVGCGIAMAGVGLLLFVGFYFATKYTVIFAIKLFKAIYCRRVER